MMQALILAKLALIRAQMQALDGIETDTALDLADDLHAQREALREVLAWVQEGRDLARYVAEIGPEARGLELDAVLVALALLREAGELPSALR